MKIDNNNLPLGGLEGKKAQEAEIQAAEAARREERSKAVGAAAGAGTGIDNLDLSGLSRSLRMEHSESPERIAYLEKLGAEVASGRYYVDAEKIGDDMIEEALEMAAELPRQDEAGGNEKP